MKKSLVLILTSCLILIFSVTISCGSSTVDESAETTVAPEEVAVTETEKPTEETTIEEPPPEEPVTTTEEEIPVEEEETAATEEIPTVKEEPTETETQEEEEQLPEEDDEVIMTLTSTAFLEGETIPTRYTCDGLDRSPELNWSGVPEGTQAFVLILDDPDAPGGTFNHWVIFNIPADTTGLEEGLPRLSHLESGAIQIRNNFGTAGYGGPCPPAGPAHNYIFTLYALDVAIDLTSSATKAQVLNAMENHVLAQAELTGLRRY